MKTSIKTLSFIAGIVLLASCSKSLTDIGYEGGSTTTTLPPDGPAFHTSIQKTGGEYIGAHAVQAGVPDRRIRQRCPHRQEGDRHRP